MKLRLPKSERLSPNHTRKISDVLFEFSGEIAPHDSPPHILENAVSLAVMLWNVPLLPAEQQKDAMVEIRRSLGTMSKPLLDAEVFRLLDLRRSRYANDRRLVVNYKFLFDQTGPNLVVASADLDRPENREPRTEKRRK